MNLSITQFAEHLIKSGLMSAEELRAFHAGLSLKERPTNVEELARALIAANQLTEFQASELLAGTTTRFVIDDYVILDRIGVGGMGHVFKAWHGPMERVVALKLLPDELATDPSTVMRFQREAKAAARLSHPNIVTAYHAGSADGIQFLVMEYVDGQDLNSVVKAAGPLRVEQAFRYAMQAARALAYAHGEGVIHRDLKPANLILGRQGTVKVLDMGLARLSGRPEVSVRATADNLTDTSQIMGTSHWWSGAAGQRRSVDFR